MEEWRGRAGIQSHIGKCRGAGSRVVDQLMFGMKE